MSKDVLGPDVREDCASSLREEESVDSTLSREVPFNGTGLVDELGCELLASTDGSRFGVDA